MSDREAFIRGILEAPDDDAPRLVFADWLEESGEPANVAHAEYIRVTCELAHTADEASLRNLQHRESELLRQWDGHWRAQVPCPQPMGLGAHDRGLIVYAGVNDPETFQSHFAALQRMLPLHQLGISSITSQSLTPFLANPALEWLTQLRLYATDIGDAGLRLLASAECLGRLELFSLTGDHITVDGTRALLESPKLPRLHKVWLGGSLPPTDFERLRERYGTRVQFQPPYSHPYSAR